MMGLSPGDPRVAESLASEDKERAALEYACGAVTAAMDALAALDTLQFAQYLDRPGDMDAQQRDTVDRLLRQTRRNLRAAVGSLSHPGYDRFIDMLSAHGLCIYAD
jgi:L-asparaginase II